jgi:hypothetical protein
MSCVMYDIVVFMRYKYIIRHSIFPTTSYVRTPDQDRRWQRSSPSTQRVSTWAEPFLRFVDNFYAAQSAGRHETRACPFVDAQNGHDHMEKKIARIQFKLCGTPLKASESAAVLTSMLPND